MATNPEPSDITTRPARAQITRDLVQPPARVYMTLDDQLYIRSRNSLAAVVLRIAGRVLTPDGEIVPFNFEHTPATDRSVSLEAFRLSEGYLLSAVVFPSAGAPQRGQTFVEIGFLRGTGVAGDVVDVLAKDYVAEAEPLAFPGSPIRSSVDGPGAILSITGTDPAAGSELSETVPTDALWKVISITALLVTDANAANRRVKARLTDGATLFYQADSSTNHVASTTFRYIFAALGFQPFQNNSVLQIPLPSPTMLRAGFVFETSTVAFQVGDNWSATQFLVEEWIQD